MLVARPPADAAVPSPRALARSSARRPGLTPLWVALAAACVLAFAGTEARAATAAWDEAVQGDLSNDWRNPAEVTLAYGENLISGATGRAAPAGTGVIDRDYLSFTVLPGQTVTAITVLAGTQSDTVSYPVSFVGLIAGDQGVDPSTTPTSTLAAQLMGYHLYGPADVGSDILTTMSSGTAFTGAPYNQPAAQGFSLPLGEGTYTLWMQETVVGQFDYRFSVTVVPEPASAVLALAGLGLLSRRLRRGTAPR